MLELENKYLTEKTQSYQKVLSLVQGIYESKQDKFEQTVLELSEKLIESYKKVMGLSEKSIHLQGEIKSLQQTLKEASETPKDTQDDISNSILNAIFGDEPKGDGACYESSLIEKMSKLSNYVFELRSEISLKETQLLSLKEQIEEKNGKLKSLYILDCPLGFEQA